MATTAIWDVKGRLDHVVDYADNPEKTANPAYAQSFNEAQRQSMLDMMEAAMDDARQRGLSNVIDYATADYKTEKQHYVTGINCDPASARRQMNVTKKRYNKTGGIIAYHGYQSFAPGEATPELAHRIGVELAQRLWGERFEVIVATHLNTKCLHNHYVLNSVSFADGLRYYDNKATYRLMREESDRLCKEYGLSVIRNSTDRAKGRHYSEWQAEQAGAPTWRSVIRADVDDAIKQAVSFQAFIRNLQSKGYIVDTQRMHMRIKPPGKERFVRIRSLGPGYEPDEIRERILGQRLPQPKARPPASSVKHIRYRGSFYLYKVTWKGLRALYYHYLYKLRQARHNESAPFLLRDELRNLDKLSAQAKLLSQYKIDTAEQLSERGAVIEKDIQSLVARRKDLRNEMRRAGNEHRKEELQSEIKAISAQLKPLYGEQRVCSQIAERSQAIRDTLTRVRAERQKEMGGARFEPNKGRGGTGRKHGDQRNVQRRGGDEQYRG